VYHEFSVATRLPLPNTVSLGSLISKFESKPDMAARMALARQKLAAELYSDEPETLSALRLASGLSQAQLAARASTTQPYIAKIEAGRTDPSTDMIARIAQALGVDETLAYRAIRNQLATRG
jgi:ribosome-binding protein aMBF1 (putative translation factor)